MRVESRLKPLYANLKRLNIGDFLNSREFSLLAIENDFDAAWKNCKREVARNKTMVIATHRDTENEEEAFMLLMSGRYQHLYLSFDDLILTTLIGFAKWSPHKLDFIPLINNLKELSVDGENLKMFLKDFRAIHALKPPKVENKIVQFNEVPTSEYKSSRKIFVVHGRDDKSRLDLCNILKDDFGLDPVVLQDMPNDSIETIISKFERLASECSAAIVLFTPDDEAGESKRARQNVIFELGYFLGKFQNKKDRRIIVLKKGNVEIPSDISGVLYLEYDRAVKESYRDLKKQFEYWGY